MTVTATTPAAAPTSDMTGLGRTQLAQNFDMFLTLLTTQMKAQDPLSPMDSNQFTAQLVQMTGVEQQLAANDLLKQLVANTGTSVSSAVSLIGKQVRATSSQAALANGQANWTYNLSGPAAEVKLEVLDAQGRTVHAEAVAGDAAKAGDHAFAWNGKDATGANLPAGTYSLRVTATDASGGTIASQTFIDGVVTGVEQVNGAAIVTINGGKVPVGQVVSITEPAPAPPSTKTADQTSAQAA